jgi:single-strand DNA-binding protein
MSEGICILTISGNIGRDPVLEQHGGSSVLKFSVAVNSRVKVDGQYGDETRWYNVALWGKRGEGMAKFLTKGRCVVCSGSLRVREYADKSGAQRYSLDLDASNVVPVGPRQDGSEPRRYPTGGGTSEPIPGDGMDYPPF